jgi:hypothetical protein
VLNGVDAVPELISGIPDGYDVHQDLRFDVLGDVERLEGRGVGFPEFKPGGETICECISSLVTGWGATF